VALGRKWKFYPGGGKRVWGRKSPRRSGGKGSTPTPPRRGVDPSLDPLCGNYADPRIFFGMEIRVKRWTGTLLGDFHPQTPWLCPFEMKLAKFFSSSLTNGEISCRAGNYGCLKRAAMQNSSWRWWWQFPHVKRTIASVYRRDFSMHRCLLRRCRCCSLLH